MVGELLRGVDYELYGAREGNRQPLHRPSRDTLAVPKPVASCTVFRLNRNGKS
jgi:hypothetical protein